MSPSDLTQALKWRYATKSFDASKNIPSDAWEALLGSMLLAPSSFGLQPWKFVIVENQAIREQLREVSWGQSQITDADKLVVFASRTDLTPDDTSRWITRLAEVQGQDPADLEGLAKVINGFANNMTIEQRHAWNMRQTYIALGQFMTSAATLRIDTCPLEGLDPSSYDRILEFEGTGYATSVGCAAGFRSSDDHSAERPKARFPREDMIEIR